MRPLPPHRRRHALYRSVFCLLHVSALMLATW
jgi:hypothetical protein